MTVLSTSEPGEVVVTATTNDINNSITVMFSFNYASTSMKIAAGYCHSLALKSDGTVWAWGWNAYSQIGDGATRNRYAPVQVQNLNLK